MLVSPEQKFLCIHYKLCADHGRIITHIRAEKTCCHREVKLGSSRSFGESAARLVGRLVATVCVVAVPHNG